MPDGWFQLAEADQRDALLAASAQIGRAPALIEKDIWVVWSLGWLYASPWKDDLVFKGGTSLSKVHRLIDRFSEDIDVTYDIRRLVPVLAEGGPDPVPATNSEAKRWTDEARAALRSWVLDVAQGMKDAAGELGAKVRCERDDIFIAYPTRADNGPGYASAEVRIEFGGRATGEPSVSATVTCDATVVDAVAGLLPVATVRAMAAERTFWEKATAAHVFCMQGKGAAERFARHWFDLACLHRHGVAQRACDDRELAGVVARHKGRFFRTTARDGTAIDYLQCTIGKLRLIPDAEAGENLRKDYDAMRNGGFLGEWQPTFDEVMRECAAVEAMANALCVPA